MTTSESSGEVDERTCYRCNEPIGDAHEIHLKVVHEGIHADTYSSVNRQICLDCLAAIGLLKFELDATDGQQETKPQWRELLSPP